MVIPKFYWVFLVLLGLQRLFEVFLSKHHEAWMKQNGGIEFGHSHYKWVVLLMVGFFLGIPLETSLRHTRLVSAWPILFGFFLVAQVLRVWATASLKKFWNVKIWVIPQMARVVRGPYRYLRHPNYLAVVIELITIPAMVQCYWTLSFTLLGFLGFLRVRLKEEERALSFLH